MRLFIGFARGKNGALRVGLVWVYEDVPELFGGVARQGRQSDLIGVARRVTDGKMRGGFILDIGLAIQAAQFAAMPRRFLDVIKLVGRVLPLGRIAGDAIGIAAR